MKKRAKNRNLLFAIVLMITFFASNATAGVPAVSDVTVTDVTTRSFSVVWISSESSLPDLIVYDDISGTVETADARITILPVNNGSTAIQNAARNIGVMKVRVTGLDSNTTYYFQTVTTSTASNQIARFPDSDPLLSVTTETSTQRTKIEDPDELPFSNDIIVFDYTTTSSVPTVEGSLILAQVEGGSHPVSGFVGDGIQRPMVILDLNNIFDGSTHGNLLLHGGEDLILTRMMGYSGIETSNYTVPENSLFVEINTPEAKQCDGDFDGDNDADGSDLAALMTELNVCNSNCNYDIDGDGDVDADDLSIFAANFGNRDCR